MLKKVKRKRFYLKKDERILHFSLKKQKRIAISKEGSLLFEKGSCPLKEICTFLETSKKNCYLKRRFPSI